MSTKSTSTRRFAVSSITSGSIVAAVIRQVQIFSDATYVTLLNETTVNNAGGYIQIVGIGFQPGCVVYFNNTLLSSTFISSTVVRATTPAVSNGSYVLLVANSLGTSNNASAIYVLTTSGFPTWSTTAYFSSSVTVSVQLVATGDAPLTYTLQSGSSLPPGTTLSSSGLLAGTVTGATNGIVYSFVVLVDDVDLQTTQATITLTIAFSDPYYKNVTLLLNGETAVTPFIQDASTNNFNLTINGDTRPTPFIPYQAGYYSNYFDGTGDYLSLSHTTANDIGTGDFTIQSWIFPTTDSGGYQTIFGWWNTAPGQAGAFLGILTNSVIFFWGPYSEAVPFLSAGTITRNAWNYIALTRSGNTFTLYLNGTSITTGTNTGTKSNLVAYTVGTYASGSGLFTGYISNVRVTKGTALSITSTPTTPLVATAATAVLTCQSNRLIDNSLNNFAITKNGDTTVTRFIPFSAPTSVTVNNLYSTFFDGTGDYLATPSNAVFAFGTSDFTVEGWFYFTGTISTYQRPWWFSDDNDNLEINGSVLRVGGAAQGTLITGGTTIVGNTWYHIALVRSTGSYRLWLNGSQQGSTATNSYNSSTRILYIMATSGGGNPSTGYVSNFRVVKGVAVYTGTFTPSTTQLTSTQLANVNGSPSEAITGTATSLLTCQNSTIIDNSSYVLTLTPAGDVRPINSTTPFTQTTTSVALTTLGGTYFDGTGDYLAGPTSNANLLFGTGDFTIEYWAYKTSSAFQTIVSFGTGTGNLRHFLDTISPSLWDGAYQIGLGNAINLNSWNHIVVQRSGTNLRFYTNGISSAIITNSSNFNVGTISIGGELTSATFLGYISDLRISKGTAVYTGNFAPPVQPLTAVTNTSLLTLQYNGGANNSGIIDNSAYNNILTRFGNTSQGTFSPFSQTGWSTFFDGSGDYLSTPSGINTAMGGGLAGNILSFEYFIFPTNFNFGANGQILSGTYAAVAANGRWFIGLDKTANLTTNFYFGWTTSTSSQTGVNTTTFPITQGQWNHVVVTIDATTAASSTIKLFANGTLLNTFTAQDLSSQTAYYQPLFIAGCGSTTYTSEFQGYISNFRILKGAFAYTGNYTVPTTPLTPISNTVLLTCQSSSVVDNSGYNFILTKTGDTSVQALSPFGSILPATPTSYSNYFDGTGDRLSIASNALLALGTGDFTIEMWVNNQSTTNRLISWGVTTSPIVYINGSNQLVYDNYGTGTLQTSTSTISLNTWTHVALSRNTGVTRMYINGVVANSTPLTDTNNWGQSGLYIGVDISTTYMTGSISNLRVLKGTGLYPNGTTFTPSTSPLTAITNTLLLTCQSTTIIDNSTNAFTITVTGDTVPRNFNPFGYTDQTNSSYSPSTVGGSIYFDGTGDYLSIPGTSPFNRLYSTTVPFTIEFWMYATGNPSPGSATILTGSLPANTTVGFRIEWQGGLMYWYSEPNAYPAVTQAVQLNQWGHYVFVWDGTNITTYLNGGSKKSAASTWTNNPTTTVSYISNLVPGTYNYYVQGYLSNLRLVVGARVYTNPFITPTTPLTNYSAVPGSTSLLLNFTSGGIIDYHSSNVLETVGNAQLSTNIKKFGNASMSFDGTTDALFQPSNVNYGYGTGDFTIEFWLYLNATTQQTIVSNLSGPAGVSPNIYYENAAGIRYYTNSANRITGSALSTGIWYHIAVSRASGSTRMFINGTQTGSTYTDANNYGTANPLGVGDYGAPPTGTSTLNGYIDDLRITKGFARYTANFNTSPPISPAAAFLTQ